MYLFRGSGFKRNLEMLLNELLPADFKGPIFWEHICVLPKFSFLERFEQERGLPQ
jgi:hypothetical protein